MKTLGFMIGAFFLMVAMAPWPARSEVKTFDLPLGIGELRIHGFRGNVTIVRNEKMKAAVMKVDGKELEGVWKPNVRKIETGVEVSFTGPADRADWRGEIKPMTIEVKGPSVPLVLTWKEGEVKIQGWDKSVEVTLLKGKLKLEDLKSNARLVVPEADVEVVRHSGRLEVDQFSSTVSIQKAFGPMNLSNFSGRLKVVDSQGDIQLKGFQGKTSFEKVDGSFNVDSSNGEVTLVDCKGPLNGKLEQGALSAQMKGPIEVRLQTQSARVQLAVPKASGARVDLGSTEGNIILSTSAIPVDRVGDMKVAKGRLPGGEEGSLFVRSESGEIRLRTQ